MEAWKKLLLKLNRVVADMHLISFQGIFHDAWDMLKLEKVEFGGIKGASLSHQVATIFEEFNKLWTNFSDLKYDPLDLETQVWETYF